jgi:hypothetical protein
MKHYFVLCERSVNNPQNNNLDRVWYEVASNEQDPVKFAEMIAAGKTGLFDKVRLLAVDEVRVATQRSVIEWSTE